LNQKKLYFDTPLLVIFSVTLMAVLGVASLTPAFPKIAQSLDLQENEVGWLISVFTLPGIFFTPVMGILADRLGRKIVLVPSLFLFAIAGFACFFTTNFELLLVFRFFQGLGSSSISSINVTLIGDIYSGKQRPQAMGYNASVLSIGTATYPFVGGLLAAIAWNMPFLLPLLAIPVGLAVIFLLHSPKPNKSQNLKQYLSSTVKSLKNKAVIGLFLISISTFIILYGAFLSYLPFLLHQKFGIESFQIGLFLSLSSLFTAFVASKLGKLITIFKQTTMLKIAFVLYALVCLLLPNIQNLYLMLLPVAFFGIAQGLNIPNLQTLLATLAPIEQRAVFMSINGMVLQIGQTLGPVFIGFIFSLSGIETAFYSAAFVAFIMLVLIFLLLNRLK